MVKTISLTKYKNKKMANITLQGNEIQFQEIYSELGTVATRFYIIAEDLSEKHYLILLVKSST